MQRTILLLLTTALMTGQSLSAASPVSGSPGGPPSIRIAEKAKGNITRAEWTGAAVVKLAGCVADARVTSMTVCINDCKGKQAALSTTSGTFSKEMKTMITNLPDGTPFTIKVEVKDGSGKKWEVPDAVFTLVR